MFRRLLLGLLVLLFCPFSFPKENYQRTEPIHITGEGQRWAERTLAATLRDGMDVIRLVQVSDFVVGTHDTPNRVVPGDGDIPLRRILSDIITAGYDGVFDLELIGPRIEEEGYESAINRAIDATTAVLDSLT